MKGPIVSMEEFVLLMDDHREKEISIRRDLPGNGADRPAKGSHFICKLSRTAYRRIIYNL